MTAAVVAVALGLALAAPPPAAGRQVTSAHLIRQDGPPEALFERANALYEAGDTDGAAAFYRRVLRALPGSVPARYNLGNAAAHQDRPAEALRHYLAVLRRAPRDAAARHNAAVVRARLRAEAGARSQAVIAELPRPPLAWISVAEAAWVSLAGAYAAAAVAALAILRPRRRRVASTVAAVIFLAALAVALSAARVAALAPEGLVVRAGAGALAGPSPDQPQVLALPAGAALRLGERRAGWVFVSLPNGLSGWMLETDVAPVF